MYEVKHLCVDEFSGRSFMSTIPELEAACNELNVMQLRSGDVCVGDFYDLIGIPPIPPGYTHGWSNEPIRLRVQGVITHDGAPAIEVAFVTDPKHEASNHTLA